MKTSNINQYPRRILLAVTGLSPQVVTETLYALCVAQTPVFMPTEIHILTTAEGAERARLNLLSADGWFYRLCKDYQLPNIHFKPDCIHVLEDVIGNRLDDIRSVVDNEQAANALTNAVREFTQDADSALHVSIAGGRKTMGFYVGYALSLYGREQDRLSHVLVSSPYEAHPDFYYPTPYSRIIHTRYGNPRPMDTKEAEVTLAEIPFVRLRHGLPTALLEGKTDFSDAVQAIQNSFAPASIRINLRKRQLYCATKPIKLSPSDLVFYTWFAQRKLAKQAPIHWTDANKDEYLAVYLQIAGKHSNGYQRACNALKNGFTKEYFEQRKAKMHSALNKALGNRAGEYRLQSSGKRPKTCYAIGLAVGQIVVE